MLQKKLLLKLSTHFSTSDVIIDFAKILKEWTIIYKMSLRKQTKKYELKLLDIEKYIKFKFSINLWVHIHVWKFLK